MICNWKFKKSKVQFILKCVEGILKPGMAKKYIAYSTRPELIRRIMLYVQEKSTHHMMNG